MASGIGGETVETIIVQVLPFVFVTTIASLVIAYAPQMLLWLPKAMGD